MKIASVARALPILVLCFVSLTGVGCDGSGEPPVRVPLSDVPRPPKRPEPPALPTDPNAPVFACDELYKKLLPTLPPAPAGSGTNCTLAGCIGGLNLELPTQGLTGHTKVVLKADGKTKTCEGTLPLAPCGGASQASFDCVGDGLFGLALSNQWCGDAPVILSADCVSSVDVDVWVDSKKLLSETVTPKYEVHFPNGRACDEKEGWCVSASVTLQPNAK